MTFNLLVLSFILIKSEKLIKDLKEENARLKQMLANGKVDPSLIGQIKTDGSTEGANQTKNNEAMQKLIEENEKAMKTMQQSYEEKLAESKKQEVEIMINICLFFKTQFIQSKKLR